MTKPVVAGIAAFVVFFVSLQFTSRLGRGDSTDPEHVALQTRQDTGSIYGSLCITNGLLAAILATLLF
jgi:hypothetical protein